jgi:hypothetical protein
MSPRHLLPIVLVAVAAGAASDAAIPAGPRAARPTVIPLDVSSSWISTRGDGLPRQTTVGFDLLEPGAATFSIRQVSPVCRHVGAFRVRGRAGRNRFLFPGRIDRRLLPPGTYRLSAGGPRDRPVRAAVVVVASGLQTPDELRRALRLDACSRRPGRPVQLPAGGVLGARFGEPPEGQSALRPFVVAFLVIAIALLGVAALPGAATPGPRTAELLVTGRPALALAGGLALAAGLGLYVAGFL